MTRGTRTRRRRTRARRRIAVTAGLLAVVLCALAVWGVWRWIARTPLVVLEQCTVAGDPDTALDTEQSSYAALIAAASVRRGLPPRAATIALATAMQESRLRNLDHGDRDSLGLFQQRPSQGWGQPAEIQDPYFATNQFYDALVQVRDYQNRPITEVAQDVQRSALPTAYARHETFGRHWASALTGYSPAALSCRLRAATQPGSAPQLTAGLVRDYGNTVSVSGPSRDNGAPTVSVTTGPNAANDQAALHRAWSVAAWAVAHAAELGIDEVQVAGRVWARQDLDHPWATDEGPRRAEPGTVRITLATADR